MLPPRAPMVRAVSRTRRHIDALKLRRSQQEQPSDTGASVGWRNTQVMDRCLVTTVAGTAVVDDGKDESCRFIAGVQDLPPLSAAASGRTRRQSR